MKDFIIILIVISIVNIIYPQIHLKLLYWQLRNVYKDDSINSSDKYLKNYTLIGRIVGVIGLIVGIILIKQQ